MVHEFTLRSTFVSSPGTKAWQLPYLTITQLTPLPVTEGGVNVPLPETSPNRLFSLLSTSFSFLFTRRNNKAKSNERQRAGPPLDSCFPSVHPLSELQRGVFINTLLLLYTLLSLTLSLSLSVVLSLSFSLPRLSLSLKACC